MKSFFIFPLAPWIWRPSATGFPWSCEKWQVILRFVGQPSTAVSNTTGPARILNSSATLQNHEAGRLLVLELLGERMQGVCWHLQRARVGQFAETLPGPGRREAWNADRGAMPDLDALGGLRLWHCTTVENGLRIMRDGRMRVLPSTVNYPQGIYSARWPAQTNDIGC